MGWLYGHNTRKDVIEDLTRTSTWSILGDNKRPVEFRRTCLAKTFKGSPWAGVLYAAFTLESREHGGAWHEKNRYILVVMIRCQKSLSQPWGYKDMDESMHPFYYGCPMKYFDLVPQVTCQKWRDQTRARWKHIAEKRRVRKALKRSRERSLALIAGATS